MRKNATVWVYLLLFFFFNSSTANIGINVTAEIIKQNTFDIGQEMSSEY